MNQFTLIDIAIALAVVGSVLGACHRGIGREMLHTVMFAILVTVGYVMFKNQSDNTPQSLSFWVVNSSYYLVTTYVLTWVGMKVLSPLVIGREQIGLRSRFWAGTLCVAKLAFVIIGLNLWFAMHSPDVHPKRLNALPAIMRDSMLVQLSDKATEQVYMWLASKQIVEFHKQLERAPSDAEVQRMELEKELGVAPSLPPTAPVE